MKVQSGFGTVGVVVVVLVLLLVGGGYYLATSNDQRNVAEGECPIGEPDCKDVLIDGGFPSGGDKATPSEATPPRPSELVSRIEVNNNTISVFGSGGELIDTLVPSDGSIAPNIFAKVSPNRRFVFYGYGRGDGVSAWVYDADDKSEHKIDFVVSTIKPAEWLEDNRLSLYFGCVTPECVQYISSNNDTPWKLETVR